VGLISLYSTYKNQEPAGNQEIGPDTFLSTMLTDRKLPAGLLLSESEQYLKKFSVKIILNSYEQRRMKGFWFL
ncbi:MAG: hypothetical protein NT084_00070, partial [Bacteroidetes bacterium]|nr:hypothetical protein [Bacteroidota bacterium]